MIKGNAKLTLFFLLQLLFISNISVFCYEAYDEEEYDLQITVRISPIRIQYVPLTVNFELKNIGNKTFDGRVTLITTTEEGSYSPQKFLVANLTKNEIYENRTRYATDDAGRYWFTFEIEASDLSRIKLFTNSKLEDQGISRVEFKESVYMFPFSLVIAIIAGIVIPLLGLLLYYKRKKD